jgi:hypothetical protein
MPAHSWPATGRATGWRRGVDATTAPDEVGRFTFGIRAGPQPGTYHETFNLLAQGLRWFDHAALGGFYVPIMVISNKSP